MSLHWLIFLELTQHRQSFSRILPRDWHLILPLILSLVQGYINVPRPWPVA